MCIQTGLKLQCYYICEYVFCFYWMLFDTFSQEVFSLLVQKLTEDLVVKKKKICNLYKKPQRQKSILKVSKLKEGGRRGEKEARLGQALNKTRDCVILSQYLNMLWRVT